MGAISASFSWQRTADASLARGLTLGELVRASAHSLVVTPLDSSCHWADFGGRRLIVTDTRVRVEDVLGLARPEASELVVRVLGGAIGKYGQRIEGQAELVLGQPSALFLTPGATLLAYVTGAAQGHYPLTLDARGGAWLGPSPHVPELLARRGSAVETLTGASLDRARELVRAERP